MMWWFDTIGLHHYYDRRKFRGETSDKMDSWKSRGGKSQRGEEKKREDQRGERVRSKKRKVREKVGKSRFTVFCHQMRDEKLHAVVARSTFPSQNDGLRTFFDVQMSFCVAGARDCEPCQKWAKREGLAAVSTTPTTTTTIRYGTLDYATLQTLHYNHHYNHYYNYS